MGFTNGGSKIKLAYELDFYGSKLSFDVLSSTAAVELPFDSDKTIIKSS